MLHDGIEEAAVEVEPAPVGLVRDVCEYVHGLCRSCDRVVPGAPRWEFP